MVNKCCTACSIAFPATTAFFGCEKGGKYGVKSRCKVCESKIKKAYYAEHPEALERKRTRSRERQRERLSHPEIRVKQHAYDKAYRDRPDVHEKRRANWKSWSSQLEHQETRRTYDKIRRDCSDVRAQRQGYQAHREARKKAIPGTYTTQQIADLLRRQKQTCYYCFTKFEQKNGKYIYHIDHTFPLSRVVGMGIPANDISYLVLACPSCNDTKGDKFPWEFPEGGRLL